MKNRIELSDEQLNKQADENLQFLLKDLKDVASVVLPSVADKIVYHAMEREVIIDHAVSITPAKVEIKTIRGTEEVFGYEVGVYVAGKYEFGFQDVECSPVFASNSFREVVSTALIEMTKVLIERRYDVLGAEALAKENNV